MYFCHEENRPASNSGSEKTCNYYQFIDVSILVAITKGKSPILKGLCPGLRDKKTALSLYEVIKDCNDTGEIGFCGGGDGGRRKREGKMWQKKNRIKKCLEEGANGK